VSRRGWCYPCENIPNIEKIVEVVSDNRSDEIGKVGISRVPYSKETSRLCETKLRHKLFDSVPVMSAISISCTENYLPNTAVFRPRSIDLCAMD
jgi:hypothetical protein